jgi:lysophospholipase L1-like esterase
MLAPVARKLAIPAVLLSALVSGCACHGHAAGGDAEGLVRPGMTVLFQGDSITDAGRDRKNQEANSDVALGHGYAALAAAGLRIDCAPGAVEVYNRGVSGHKVFQLAERWDVDCLELHPDVVSILIGVNDIWHTRSGKYDGTVEVYERDFDALLTRTREALPDVKLVVCEPFVMRCGAVDDSWFPEFDEYRAAARRVADAHGAIFVPFQSMFDDALRYGPAESWAKDGVHPSREGAALMAKTWLECVQHAGH